MKENELCCVEAVVLKWPQAPSASSLFSVSTLLVGLVGWIRNGLELVLLLRLRGDLFFDCGAVRGSVGLNRRTNFDS